MAKEKVIKLRLAEKLESDEEFRQFFFRSLMQHEIAEQIIAMRKKRSGMRQTDLALATEMKQSAISRIEQADYARWNYQTLARIAEALDARWQFRLHPAEDVISEYREQEEESTKTGATAGTIMPIDVGHHRTYQELGIPKKTGYTSFSDLPEKTRSGNVTVLANVRRTAYG